MGLPLLPASGSVHTNNKGKTPYFSNVSGNCQAVSSGLTYTRQAVIAEPLRVPATAHKPTTSGGGDPGAAPDDERAPPRHTHTPRWPQQQQQPTTTDDGLFYSVAGIRLWALAVSHPLGGDLNSPSSHAVGPESPRLAQARPTSASTSSSTGWGSWRDFHERRHPVGSSWLSLSSGSPRTGCRTGEREAAPRVVVGVETKGGFNTGRPERPEEPYHIFNRRQKWLLVVATGALTFFAGLASNIYFPVQNEIVRVRLLLLTPNSARNGGEGKSC